jgi:hypothetical protein
MQIGWRECLVTQQGVTCLQYTNIASYILFYTTMKLFETLCSDIWQKKSEMKDVDVAMISFT